MSRRVPDDEVSGVPADVPDEVHRVLLCLAGDVGHVGTFDLDLVIGRRSWDARVQEVLGLTAADVDGPLGGFEDQVLPEDRERVRAAVAEAVGAGGTVEQEFRILRPDGRRRWVTARGRALRDDSGAAVRVLGALVDSTGRRTGHERAEEILEAMSVGYLAMDEDWRITYVNTEAVTVLGLPREELVGGIIFELFPATVGSDFEAGYRRAVETGEPVTFDAYYPPPLGAWYEVRATPEAGGLALYFLDITARQVAQDAAGRTGRRLASLGEVALALADARDMTDLVTTMAERGLGALGADGGAVAVPDPDDPGFLLSYITVAYGSDAQATFGRLHVGTALPVCEAYTTGRRVLVPDLEAAQAYSSLMREVVAATGSPVYASIPMRADGEVMGVLTAGWEETQPFDREQLDLLETFASQCAQALQRLRARDAEHAATAAARQAAEQQAALVGIAMSLDGADTAEAVMEVVTLRGVSLLGAQSAVLCLDGPAGGAGEDRTDVRALTCTVRSEGVHVETSWLPADLALPMVQTVATGTPQHFGDRAEAEAAYPSAASGLAAARTGASASVPLRAGGAVTGSLSVTFDHDRPWHETDRDLLEAVAALTAQALERLSARDAERAATVEVAQFAETLQRSLLSSPPQPDHLQIAVRYAPAAAQAEVGGDWYDAFVTAAGTTSLVIGDVTGHDRHAAASMAQLRNLLRGIGYAVGEPPAAVLGLVDRALHDLAVDAMATVLVAQVDQAPDGAGTGLCTLRWSNAGHLPPLLLHPDGTAEFLTTEPDLLLGVDAGSPRADHEVALPPGTSVLLFTDGLVERRDADLQEGLDWLARSATALAHLPLGELCDALLSLVGDRVEDDVALLAARPHPGPSVVPARASAGTVTPTAVGGEVAPRGTVATGAVGDAVALTESLVLEPDPVVVRRARDFVRRHCEAAGAGPDTVDTVVLLTSELVTNAFLHGRSQTRLVVSTSPQAVRVEVSDDNSRRPTLGAADTTALQGRGMTMVDLLATAWGTREEDLGKTVWFTLVRT